MLARAQAQRGLDVVEREIVLTGKYPETAAQIPAAGIARVERERTVHQPDHGADILAQMSQHESGDGEDAGVVLRHLQRLPGEIAALAAGCPRFLDPTVNDEPQMAFPRPGKSKPPIPTDRARLV